ncbi:Smi1p NDAI_0D02510 [Naumovozyma dairenensis CBS 421]|uniref:Knr4/Smi1-like domain-containing protein n=1 Tax=Naumovozyma dairenensis (strain ATCC 10597 / BCRC 20456 / CBS 421 / NBRC 0211 / NRRL Y-12639) TaxID=1071378 RepID=G0W9V4_NAUDC|nr:hypothetical protein NDAI_0D02510 [Naumovozyma dairenensis CBS 421]CCD24565.1 hypothetical protein NDAI_0D02510 [Naumovozyma dairenensis CBS 421]
MNIFKKKIKEWAYSFSTEDRYAEYDPNTTPSFNMAQRNTSAMGATHNNNGTGHPHMTSSHDDLSNDELNIGMADPTIIPHKPEGYYNDDDLSIHNTKDGVADALLAWRHIDSWTDQHNPDLSATLSDPCTLNDIANVEEDLEIFFPPSVKASFRVHDGQEDLESMTGTSGIIYGMPLMTLDQIVAMSQTWRKVAKNMNKIHHSNNQSRSNLPSNNNSTSSFHQQQQQQQQQQQAKNQFKLPFIPEQQSFPPNHILTVYAHPNWIPLLTDNAGNHVGVDLAPGPMGKYGQIIIFGREWDTKYVVASNWGEFLLSFANDLEAGNWLLVDDNDDFFAGDGELVYRDKSINGVPQDYLEVLKKRTIKKYQQEQQRENQSQQQQQQQQMNENIHSTYNNNLKTPSIIKENSVYSTRTVTDTDGSSDMKNEDYRVNVLSTPVPDKELPELPHVEKKQEEEEEMEQKPEHKDEVHEDLSRIEDELDNDFENDEAELTKDEELIGEEPSTTNEQQDIVADEQTKEDNEEDRKEQQEQHQEKVDETVDDLTESFENVAL